MSKMNAAIEFSLTFKGSEAENHRIDLYDVSQALIGFQRSLALTAHLVINGEVITQAPALKGASILSPPPEAGSWEVTAILIAGAYTAATAPKDTPLGHLIYSLYDYVISKSLGFHVDYDRPLGKQYKRHQEEIRAPQINQDQVDLLIDKFDTAISDIHRPIVKSKSATSALIESNLGGQNLKVGGPIDVNTHKFLYGIANSELQDIIRGIITSYNSNTFKGRIYVEEEGFWTQVPFELDQSCRSDRTVQLILDSLRSSATNLSSRKLMFYGRELERNYDRELGIIYCKAIAETSRTGKLKKYFIIEMSETPIFLGPDVAPSP